MKRIILLSVIWLIALYCMAQPLCEIKEYTIKDGLAQSVITGTLQDRCGFMWFSTWDGLNKFDGYTFRKYKSFQGDGSTLTNNRLLSITETRYGDIWCQTFLNKVYLFDNSTEKFIDVLYSLENERQQTFTVRKIYSLPKGFAWITCDQGNNFRINEKEIKNGKGIHQFSTFNNTIKGENIYNIYQDVDEDEWILTDNGVTIVGNKTINSNFSFQFIIELNKEIWLASKNGKLAKYDKTTSTPIFVELPLCVEEIISIESLDNRTLAIGSSKGLVLFNILGNTFKQINIITPTQRSASVTNIYKDKVGELWLFTRGKGVTRVNIETEEVKHFYTPEAEAIHYERTNNPMIFEDPAGFLWVLPREGNFSYYNRTTGKLESYLVNPDDPKSGFHPYVRNIFSDKQGNIWLTSARALKKMSFFQRNYKETELDHDMDVRAFLLDSQNNFWVASKSGKIRIFDENNNFKGYLSNDGKITQGANIFLCSTYCFMKDRDGNIWIGTRHNGIYLLKRKGNDFLFEMSHYVHIPNDRYSLSNNSIYSIFQDNKGQIWVGSYQGGLNLITKDENNDFKFIHAGNRLNNYPVNNAEKVRYITQLGDSVMIAGTTEGLLTFSSEFRKPEEIIFHRNIRQPQINTSISSNDVMQIFTDSRNETYLVTFAGGINKIISDHLLSDSIRFKAYTERNGLASDLTTAMMEDRSGNLWIVSENTLTRFNQADKVVENFGQEFFKKPIYFSESIPGINASGDMVFGTSQGIISIVPDEINKSNYTPTIAFTELKIQGNDSHKDIDNLQKLLLQPSQRNIILQFAALDFINTDEISYAYRLKGLEEGWNYTNKNHSASYLSIPSGKYYFEVRSTNSDGVWVDNTRTLAIEALPTFWETAWAWLLYAVLLIALIGTIVYVLFYIYRLRHRVNMEQQLSNIKLRFFTDISHELRTPLTLISTPVTEVLEHESLTPMAKEHLTLVQKNTNRMLWLVNQILDFRKIQNKKMKVLVEETEIISLLTKISGSFLLIAEEKQIKFELCNKAENIRLWIDKDKFEKIFYNLISNAFKYTPQGKNISIQINEESQYVNISVIDEGIGIQPQKLDSLFQRFETLANNNILQPSSGIGLSLVRELVELHHGCIEVTSEYGKGSEFKIKLPKGNRHFEKDKQAEFILSDSESQAVNENAIESASRYEDLQNIEDNVSENTEEKLSILIVEDNDELRRFLRNILSHDYAVTEASNGQEGMEKVWTDLPPDIIISDIMMPVMDGLDMVAQIKDNKDTCHIPIILLSAKSALDDRIKGIEYGIDDYIIKPFSATYLKTRITSILKQRKLLQEKYMAAYTDKRSSNLDISPSEPHITPFDEIFLKNVVQFVEDNIDKAEITIDDFAGALMMSRTVFYRKLKSLVGLSPVDFMREIRLKRAAQLIDSGEYNFSQVAYMSGFNDPKYFAKCFKKQMGVTPSEYKGSRLIPN